jgi:hypothetical protein
VAHVSLTDHAACQWNGQAHILSAMNGKARVAQRRHARFRPLAYAARSMPHGSIGSPPERGAGVYTDRSSSQQTRSRHVSALDPRLGPDQGPSVFWPGTLGPYCGRPGPHTGGGGPDPILGVRFVHVGVLDQTWRSGLHIQGSRTFPWGSELTVDALGYITFPGHVFGHVAVLEPPMWWGQVLLLAQSSRPRLG